MSLELTVLGCSGSGPAPGAPASGYLVRSETTAVWMDAGTGTFMALAEIMDPASLDAVVISHFHADHCADFFGFFHYVAYRCVAVPQIPVFVPVGGRAKIGGFLDADDDHPVWRVLDVDEVEDGGVRHVGEMALLFAAAAHSVPTNAVRIESGRSSLAFSADTGPGGGFPWLASKADVVLVEAALAEPRAAASYQFHLSGAEAGTIAREAAARRLILTHLAPTLPASEILQSASTAFGGPTELATPGLEITF